MKIRRILADLMFKRVPVIGAIAALLYGYFKRPLRSYSLYGEDLLLLELFQYCRGGVYVDIGAFHERWLSNSHALAKLGWRGAVVDVDRSKLLSFSMRRDCIKVLGAVVPSDFQGREVVLFKFNRLSSEYDTIDRSAADEYVRKYGLVYTEETIEAIRIDALLSKVASEYGAPVRYLNIDVEGVDEVIVSSINPKDYGIEVIQFENNHQFGGSKDIKSYLEAHGFERVATQGGTHTYADRTLIAKRFEV